MEFYTDKNGQRLVVRASTNSEPLGEDHMSVFRRLARFTGHTPGTADCIHNQPSDRVKKGGGR